MHTLAPAALTGVGSAVRSEFYPPVKTNHGSKSLSRLQGVSGVRGPRLSCTMTSQAVEP